MKFCSSKVPTTCATCCGYKRVDTGLMEVIRYPTVKEDTREDLSQEKRP